MENVAGPDPILARILMDVMGCRLTSIGSEVWCSEHRRAWTGSLSDPCRAVEETVSSPAVIAHLAALRCAGGASDLNPTR